MASADADSTAQPLSEETGGPVGAGLAPPAPTGPPALSTSDEASEVRTDLGQVEYVAVGHISVDIFEKRYILGGSASYAALAARQLGQQVGVLTSADFEPLLIDTLIGHDQMREPETPIRVLRVPTQSTTMYVNEYDEHGRTQYLLGRAADLRPIHVPDEWKTAPVVHLAPLAQEIDPGLLHIFPSSLLLITPQGWMRGWDQDGKVYPVTWEYADEALARADVVIFSTDDLPVPALIAEYAKKAKVMVVTENRRGCLVYERGKAPWRSHAFRPAREIDPTGAGDVFAASYATHYHRTGNPRVAADFANAAASFVLEKRAWQGIPTAQAVADRLKRGKRRGA
jgi:sugar/nucleoside kinase (ribokinase family)